MAYFRLYELRLKVTNEESFRTGYEQTPPANATFAALTIAQARGLIGRDAILRDGKYFGRRGLIKAILPDAAAGFLVLVLVYKRDRVGRRWELLEKPCDLARAYWEPGKVEIAC